MTAHPDAQLFVRAVLHKALTRTPNLEDMQERLRSRCAVRLRDMIDHIAVPFGERAQEAAGWKPDRAHVWSHPSPFLPRIVEGPELGVAFRVECIERLLQILESAAPISGASRAPIRRARLFAGDGIVLDAVERNGSTDLQAPHVGEPRLRRAAIHQQIFRTRRRHFKTVESGFCHTERLVDAAIADLGQDWACALFLCAEREYWLSRCEAGVLQKRRQDRAGVGWCTLDHIAYCSSRERFQRAAMIFEKLGYARLNLLRAEGSTGCGVQVLAHTSGSLPCLLLEVDLADETCLGAAALQPLTWHGRAGLWCAMHGESLLEGGPSRVAARYDIDALSDLARRDGAELVSPFAGSSHLRQCIAPAQFQAVNPVRIDTLERAGYLTREDAETLRMNGAIAVHFQAVDRSGGFTGFTTPDYADPAFSGPEACRAPPERTGAQVGRRAPVRLRRRRPVRR